MSGTVLLTLGRLPKALDLARAFAAAGRRVVVAEPHARHLVGASRAVAARHVVTAPAVDRRRYLDELLAVIERERVELVVPVSEEAMHVAFLHGRLPAGVRLLAMPPDTMLRLHHKGRFVEACREYGLAAPDTAAADEPLAAAIAARGRYVTKPAYSCSGRGVAFHAAGTPLRGAACAEPAAPGGATAGVAGTAAPGGGTIVQAFVPGEVCSTCTLAHRGRVQLTVAYRAAVLSGTVAVCFERIESQAIEDWVARFVARSGWNGFVSFDFVVDAAGRAFAIECNPRTTSGLHFFDAGGLARGVLSPDDPAPLRPRPARTLMQFWACLTELGDAIGDAARYRRVLGAMLRARDVTWSARDPWPLLSMPWTAWPIIRDARARGVPFGEVATLDVGWYADPPQAPAPLSAA